VEATAAAAAAEAVEATAAAAVAAAVAAATAATAEAVEATAAVAAATAAVAGAGTRLYLCADQSEQVFVNVWVFVSCHLWPVSSAVAILHVLHIT